METEGHTHQLYFYYPKRGGIQSLIQSLAKSIPRIKTSFRVKSILKNKDIWSVSDGRSAFQGRQLISTIPPMDLIASLEGVPYDVKKRVDQLKYNSLILVMAAVKHEGLLKRAALYIPDPKILPHRVCFMKYFSSSNAPAGASHLIAEITVPPSSACLTTSPDLLIDRVISDIRDLCEFSANDVIVTDIKIIKYAYVIYDSRYIKNMQLIYDFLKSVGIHHLGRFGSFKYLNMDQCVEEAKRLVQSLTRTFA
jgi:protoporphyrinogen oxidase